MLKPDSLRAALVAALPDLARNPDRLAIFAERGRIAARFAPPARGFEYRYDLKVVLIDFADHPDRVILPVLRWLEVNQPDLLQGVPSANQAITFAAEFIDAGTVDLELTLTLSESVVVVDRADGGVDLTHLEPQPFEVTLGPGLSEVWDGDGRLPTP